MLGKNWSRRPWTKVGNSVGTLKPSPAINKSQESHMQKLFSNMENVQQFTKINIIIHIHNCNWGKAGKSKGTFKQLTKAMDTDRRERTLNRKHDLM